MTEEVPDPTCVDTSISKYNSIDAARKHHPLGELVPIRGPSHPIHLEHTLRTDGHMSWNECVPSLGHGLISDVRDVTKRVVAIAADLLGLFSLLHSYHNMSYITVPTRDHPWTIPQALRASQCTLQNSPPRPCAVSFRNGISMPLLANRPRTLSRLIIKSASPQATATASMAEVNLDYKAVLPDYNFLCSLVKTIPLVLDSPVSTTEEQDFQLPLGMLFATPSRESGLQMKETFSLLWRKRASSSNSVSRTWRWDVTYKPSGVMSAKTGTTAHSHSHGDGEFSWHTEGCFELMSVPKARIENFSFGQFLIFCKELSISHSVLPLST
ncbi:hypothetical protein B0H14DRAFT_2639806 [Mycena olivaceomarginata]|nr:hypothetical protein B0H14DRAFT_2639806 [Mycena olivaceomarginata]